MNHPPAKSAAVGCFTHIGLFVIVALGALPFLALTVIVPPWVKVESQRRQVLYWSERSKVVSQTFAGYDFLFTEAKWQRTVTEVAPPTGSVFDAEEYEIYWQLVFGEWVAIILAGVVVFFVASRRIQRGLNPPKANVADKANWEIQS